MIRRVDPRRPALITPQGLRRIVLGGTEGERGLRLAAVSHATARRPRLTLPSEMGERFQLMGFERDVDLSAAFLAGDLTWRL